jgi:phage repressor protein C with HTH and peptisase S24 domain
MQLLEQKKDEWKRQVGSMQAEHQQQVETQRYEVAAAAPARAGGDDEGAPLPASWLRRASFVDPRDRLVHCLTQVVTFL